MKLQIPLKDIMITPGERLNVAGSSEDIVIEKIKNAYGVIAEVMDVHVRGGMVHITFRDVMQENFNEAMAKLEAGVREASEGRLLKALKLFQGVLSVIPENVDARRNMAKVYLQLGNMEKAKTHLFECLQLNAEDAWSKYDVGQHLRPK